MAESACHMGYAALQHVHAVNEAKLHQAEDIRAMFHDCPQMNALCLVGHNSSRHVVIIASIEPAFRLPVNLDLASSSPFLQLDYNHVFKQAKQLDLSYITISNEDKDNECAFSAAGGAGAVSLAIYGIANGWTISIAPSAFGVAKGIGIALTAPVTLTGGLVIGSITLTVFGAFWYKNYVAKRVSRGATLTNNELNIIKNHYLPEFENLISELLNGRSLDMAIQQELNLNKVNTKRSLELIHKEANYVYGKWFGYNEEKKLYRKIEQQNQKLEKERNDTQALVIKAKRDTIDPLQNDLTALLGVIQCRLNDGNLSLQEIIDVLGSKGAFLAQLFKHNSDTNPHDILKQIESIHKMRPVCQKKELCQKAFEEGFVFSEAELTAIKIKALSNLAESFEKYPDRLNNDTESLALDIKHQSNNSEVIAFCNAVHEAYQLKKDFELMNANFYEGNYEAMYTQAKLIRARLNSSEDINLAQVDACDTAIANAYLQSLQSEMQHYIFFGINLTLTKITNYYDNKIANYMLNAVGLAYGIAPNIMMLLLRTPTAVINGDLVALKKGLHVLLNNRRKELNIFKSENKTAAISTVASLCYQAAITFTPFADKYPNAARYIGYATRGLKTLEVVQRFYKSNYKNGQVEIINISMDFVTDLGEAIADQFAQNPENPNYYAYRDIVKIGVNLLYFVGTLLFSEETDWSALGHTFMRIAELAFNATFNHYDEKALLAMLSNIDISLKTRKNDQAKLSLKNMKNLLSSKGGLAYKESDRPIVKASKIFLVQMLAAEYQEREAFSQLLKLTEIDHQTATLSNSGIPILHVPQLMLMRLNILVSKNDAQLIKSPKLFSAEFRIIQDNIKQTPDVISTIKTLKKYFKEKLLHYAKLDPRLNHCLFGLKIPQNEAPTKQLARYASSHTH